MRVCNFIVIGLQITGVPAPPFPAWVPGDDEVICAKPQIYYQTKCFDPFVEEKYKHVKQKFSGSPIKKLQMMCLALIQSIGHCLKWFNDKCSKDYLQTGQGDFTAATTSSMSRKALREFKEKWDNRGNSAENLYYCTVYGGLCEHPDQLEYCRGTLSSNPISLITAASVSLWLSNKWLS